VLSKVILQGYILVPDVDSEIVKTELIVHSNLTKQEPGCLIFKVTPDIDNPNRFSVYEEFVDQAAFDLHQSRVKNSNWGKVTTLSRKTLSNNKWCLIRISGRYDTDFRFESSSKPFFDRLGTDVADKKHIVEPTGHFVSDAVTKGETLDWLDKYLGPVGQ
jgi:autoinducer 2-degrading protein